MAWNISNAVEQWTLATARYRFAGTTPTLLGNIDTALSKYCSSPNKATLHGLVETYCKWRLSGTGLVNAEAGLRELIYNSTTWTLDFELLCAQYYINKGYYRFFLTHYQYMPKASTETEDRRAFLSRGGSNNNLLVISNTPSLYQVNCQLIPMTPDSEMSSARVLIKIRGNNEMPKLEDFDMGDLMAFINEDRFWTPFQGGLGIYTPNLTGCSFLVRYNTYQSRFEFAHFQPAREIRITPQRQRNCRELKPILADALLAANRAVTIPGYQIHCIYGSRSDHPKECCYNGYKESAGILGGVEQGRLVIYSQVRDGQTGNILHVDEIFPDFTPPVIA